MRIPSGCSSPASEEGPGENMGTWLRATATVASPHEGEDAYALAHGRDHAGWTGDGKAGVKSRTTEISRFSGPGSEDDDNDHEREQRVPLGGVFTCLGRRWTLASSAALARPNLSTTVWAEEDASMLVPTKGRDGHGRG